MSKKKFILSGATIAILLVIGITFGLLNTKNSAAYALAQQTSNTVSALPSNQQQAVNQQLGGVNAEEILQAAEQAKNLTVLTYTQLVQSGSNHLPPNGTDFTSLKYLRYTDSCGAVVTVGVDSQNIPVFISSSRIAPGGTESSHQAAIYSQNVDGSCSQ